MDHRRSLSPGLAVSVVVLASACSSEPDAASVLSSTDAEAVRAVEEAYVSGWEANDPEDVMATLTSDAVILPDGMRPVRGDSAIRAFWWPDDGSETRVTSYATRVEEVSGSGDVAVLRGRGDLEFDWRAAAGDEWQHVSSTSVWMAVQRRGADGRWRMTHRMWHPVDER